MKGLLFRRFLSRPGQVAYIMPSSKILVRKVADKMDLSKPRVIAEFGPGEGVHTRELLRRAHPDTRFILFELDPELAEFNRRQFAHDRRVEVLCQNACEILQVMDERNIDAFDYIFSGIPFSLMDPETKQTLMHNIHEALAPNSSFIIYQITNELKRYGQHFDKTTSEWCPMNIPPMFVTVYHKNGKNPGQRFSKRSPTAKSA